MPTQQDTFINEDYLNETLGTTVTGGELISEDLQSGNVLSFDGNDYITIAGLVSDISADTAGTWSAWIKADAFDVQGGRIISLGDTNAIGYLEFSTTSLYEIQASARSSTGVKWDIESDEILEVDTWYHVVLVQNGTSPVLYINGILAPSHMDVTTDTTVWASDLTSQLDNAYIGDLSFNSIGLGTYTWNGIIAQVTIFNYALNAVQIAALYKYGYDNNQSVSTSPVSYWKLDEGAGTSATDYGTGANTGTIAGATWGDGSIYTLESRTTSDDKLGSTDTPTSITDFKYTTSKKGGGVGARMGFSQDYDTQREGVVTWNGTSSTASVATPTETTDMFDGGGTIMAWIRPNTYGGTNAGRIVATSDSSNNFGWNYLINSGEIQLLYDFSVGGVGNWKTATTPIVLNLWTHVAITYNADSVSNNPIFYVNGEVRINNEDGTPVGTRVTDASSTLHLGSRAGVDRWFDGEIADVRMYKGDILSAATILAYYNDGTAPSETVDGHYEANETSGTLSDSSGNGNTLSATSLAYNTNTDLAHITSTWKNVNNDTLVRGAYSFDGVNDYISVADSASMSITGDMTFSTWVKFNNLPSSSDMRFLTKYVTTGNQRSFTLFVRDTAGAKTIHLTNSDDGSAAAAVSATITLEAGVWTQLAWVYDASAGGVEYFKDGVSIGTDTGLKTSMFDSTAVAYIGAYNTTLDFLDGDLADSQLYDAALSTSEIWDIYANSKPRATNQVSRWKLNGNALDEWSTNHGTVSGAIPLPARANTPVIGDSLNQRSIASFDGVNDVVDVGDDSSLQNIFDGGGTLSTWVYTAGDGGGSGGRIADKRSASGTGWIFMRDAGGIGGVGELRLYHEFSTTSGGWNATGTLLTIGEWTHVAVTYNNSSIANNPIFYINGVAQPISENSTPVGTRDSDVGQDMNIGNVDNLTTAWDGQIANLSVYSDIRTDSEILTDYENGYIDEDNANLVSYWPLDGDYLDWKGSNDGTNNGSTLIQAIDGPMGKRNFGHNDVLSFDGVDDYVEVPHDASLDTNTAMSISVWAKVAVSGALDVIVDKRVGAGNRSWTIEKSATDLYSFAIRKSDDSTWVTVGSINIASDTWTHIVGTFDGSNLRLYVDGTLEDTDSSYSGTIQAGATSPLKIGATANSPDGYISNVALYNDALTADEVKYIYTNGNQGSDPTTTNLVSQWLLDEGTGTTATDNAGSNNGTITSATWDKALVPPMSLSNQVTMDVTSLSATDTIFVRAYMDNLIQRATSPVAFAEWTIEYLAAGGIVSENSLFFGTMF